MQLLMMEIGVPRSFPHTLSPLMPCVQLLVTDDGGDDAAQPLTAETEGVILRLLLCAAVRASSGIDATNAVDESGKVITAAPLPTVAVGIPPIAGSPNIKVAPSAAAAAGTATARDELTAALAAPLPGLFMKVGGLRMCRGGWVEDM